MYSKKQNFVKSIHTTTISIIPTNKCIVTEIIVFVLFYENVLVYISINKGIIQ